MLYNIHEVTQACLYGCAPHLVAVVLGQQQAECLAAQLTTENEGFAFIASLRPLTEPLTHWVDASFSD